MMNWIDKLSIDYPLMFTDRFALPAVGNGWKDIIIGMCRDIAAIDKDSIVRVLQVKEKFGGLRFYYGVEGGYEGNKDLWKEVEKIVRAGEAEAYKTCEYCGIQPATQTKSMWIKTLCEPCMTNALKRRERK
jgi:hypothetical protein